MESSYVATLPASARRLGGRIEGFFCALMILGATLTVRNLRRGWYYLNAGERDFTWTGFVRRVAIAGVMALGCGIDLVLGPIQSSFVLILIPIVLQLVRLIARHAPSAARLHITSQTLEGSPAS